MRLCVVCGAELTGQKIKHCSRKCQRRSYKLRHHEQLSIYRKNYYRIRREKLRETRELRKANKKLLDGAVCIRCSKETNLHIHHIRPVSLGGSSHITNLTTLCSSCHSRWHVMFNNTYWLMMPEMPIAHYALMAKKNKLLKEVLGKYIQESKQLEKNQRKKKRRMRRPTQRDEMIPHLPTLA